MVESERNKAVTLIGIGDDGCAGLTGRAANALSRCQVIAGGERHLSFFPDFAGERIFISGNLTEALNRIAELSSEHSIAVLASGDPMFFGIGSRLIDTVGCEHVEVIPHPGAMQYAFAKIGMKWDDADWISLHGRKNKSFVTSLRQMSKVIIFTDSHMNPAVIAEKMTEYGETEWTAWLCENLSGPGEQIRFFENVSGLIEIDDISPLNVLILKRKDPEWKKPHLISGFHEDMFAKRIPSKGLITKKEIRIFTLAAMGLRSDSIVWDIGAASGSVAIESAMIAHRGHAYAVEMNHESIEHCLENTRAFGTDNVTVLEGRAPEIFSEIKENPDAVFIGGSNGSLGEIMLQSYQRLNAGGRLVVNAITFENIQEAYACFKELNVVPEITMLNISRAVPLARFMRYEAQNPIHIFCAEKLKK